MVLDSLPGIADSEALAAAAIARMSEQERYDTLLALLPQVVRDEDRRRAEAGSSEADDPATAWSVATEHRVRLHGADMFLAAASAAEVSEMAETRRRSGQSMAGSAVRFEAMAEAMRSSGAETVAGLEPEVGLAVLRQDLRTARRRVANRDALQRLAEATDALAESPAFTEARTMLTAAQQRLQAAEQEHTRLEGLAATMVSIGYERRSA